MRVLVRRERAHPGAQLSLFEHRDGWRYQGFATDTPIGQLAHLEARHRAHARVEDRIRCSKDTGLGRFSSRQFALNAVWLELALTAADLIAWTQTALLDGDLARAEPKTLRYRLLHVGRPDHPRTTPYLGPHRRTLALGTRPRHRVPAADAAAAASHLTPRPT